MSTDFADAIKAGGLVAHEAIRDRLVADLDDCGSFRDRCALYRLLHDALDRVEVLRAAEPVVADEIEQIRRRRKRIGPAGTSPRRAFLDD